ncbi:MAG: SDR family NAD(P)-dependent oxidoreductase [Bacteroidetes bacterium]|nr:SDR family NAD(P)-dependent oxidoreductase [Bacteroidota bacterium]
MNLNNKVILITGASTGIGKAMAKLLAKENCSLALIARRGELLDELTGQIKTENPNIKSYVCDVAKPGEVKKVFTEVREHFKKIDIAILNAGVGSKSSAEDYKYENAKNTFDVNVLGIVNCVENLLPDFIKCKDGMIVGVSSLADSRGWQGSGFYCASKAAATILLENLRAELKPFNIKVITVKPGFVETPMTANNKFPMPFLMSAEKAARIIIGGIKKEKRIIQFPLPTVLGSKLMRVVPDSLFEYISIKN